METIIVSKDSRLMQMIRNAKARKQAWQESIKTEMEAMEKELLKNQHEMSILG